MEISRRLSQEEKERRKLQRRQEKWNATHKEINDIDHKICNICKEWFPATNVYFYNNGNKVDGLQPWCKECTKEKAKNSNADIERRKYLSRKWKQDPENRESVKRSHKKYKERGGQLNWERNNKDKLKKYRIIRKMNKSHDITEVEWNQCKKYFNLECAYCGLHISEHFNKFKGDMIWTDFHREHVDHNGSNNLSNCVPSCKTCNSSKNEFEFEYWYKERSNNFDENRFNKIIQWLDKDYKKIYQERIIRKYFNIREILYRR